MRRLTILFVLCLMVQGTAQNFWRDAVGDLRDVSREHRIFFADHSDFRFNPRPWGTKVSEYRNSWHREPTQQRHTIVVRWLGSPDPGLSSREIKNFLEAFFQLPVRMEVDPNFRFPVKNRGKRSSDKIRASLRRSLPRDAFCVIGLVTDDIYSEDNGPTRLLFGEGHYVDRTAVASVSRLRSRDRVLYNHRIFKLLAHELVHTFSVQHCGYFSCLMNSSGSIEGSDRRPLFLCPVCLRKQHSAIGFDPRKRYQQLLRALAPALRRDVTWLRGRLERTL